MLLQTAACNCLQPGSSDREQELAVVICCLMTLKHHLHIRNVSQNQKVLNVQRKTCIGFCIKVNLA